jgi:hypothetical protein
MGWTICRAWGRVPRPGRRAGSPTDFRPAGSPRRRLAGWPGQAGPSTGTPRRGEGVRGPMPRALAGGVPIQGRTAPGRPEGGGGRVGADVPALPDREGVQGPGPRALRRLLRWPGQGPAGTRLACTLVCSTAMCRNAILSIRPVFCKPLPKKNPAQFPTAFPNAPQTGGGGIPLPHAPAWPGCRGTPPVQGLKRRSGDASGIPAPDLNHAAGSLHHLNLRAVGMPVRLDTDDVQAVGQAGNVQLQGVRPRIQRHRTA